jgi:DNA replication protein DnaC
MTKQELIQGIEDMQAGLNDVDAAFRPKLQEKIEEFKKQLAQIEAEETMQMLSSTTPQPAPAPQPMTSYATASTEYGVQQIVEMMKALMSEQGGGGSVDSVEVRNLIKTYLENDKVKLNELDQRVIDFIRQNQKITLELPAFGMNIEMSKADSQIPDIYSIIDDVLAGNNVYLIGEAGTGKTYSAEVVAKLLSRKVLTINCSQYTAPTEIVGGQTIEGFKEGKLIKAWRDGDILILDEMPKLDPNTAGLFNDALAKSSKTRPLPMSKISSANPEDPQFERNPNFACIATGNIYPNSPDTRRYVGNNQQDLSLLDRFSGSVYFVEFSKYQDQKSCRYDFLYKMLVGNYHDYMQKKRAGSPLPEATGLRTIMESLDMKNYALVSYRTLISFRVAFEYELVRAIAKSEGKTVTDEGKSVLKCFNSYLVAFPRDAKKTLIETTKFTEDYIKLQVDNAIRTVLKSSDKMIGFVDILAEDIKKEASEAFKESKDWSISEVAIK